jgi:hypothetical protein
MDDFWYEAERQLYEERNGEEAEASHAH